jgi:hypothetical protein
MSYPQLINEVYNVYNNDKDDVEIIEDFVPMLSSDKYIVFINDNKKELVYAVRGISLNNRDDLVTLTNDIIPIYQGGLRGGNKHLGSTIEEDLFEIENIYKIHKREYPEYKHVFTGHSRGGGIALALGRKNNVETHAYAPISSKIKGRYYESADYDPENINIYYTAFDIAPKYLREEANRSLENHNLIPVKKNVKEWFISRGHSIEHFLEEPTNLLEPIPKKLKPDRQVKKLQKTIKVNLNNIFVTYNNFYSQNKLYNIFKRVDKNGDGYLNEEEYFEFLKELSIHGGAYSLTR